jgi:hypothetical protein
MASALARVGVVCASLGLGVGCNQLPTGVSGPAAGEMVPGQSAAVVTEHHFEPPRSASDTGKPVGADCSEHGADTCASRLCLHTTASRTTGYVCSQGCVGNENCPASWRCAHTYPSAEGALCVPGNAPR